MFLKVIDDILDKTVVFGYDRIGYHARKAAWDDSETDVSMTGKTVLITGANSGLGKAAAKALAGKNASVHMLVRNEQSGNNALEEIRSETGNENLHLHTADLSSQSQIRSFCERFQKQVSKLDVLINNAGVLPSKRTETEDGIELTLAVNLLSGHMLTGLLTDLLKKPESARVINVSSGGMYLAGLRTEDPEYKNEPFDGVKAYAHTKRAQVVMTEYYAKKFKDTNISFYSMHPGWADTKSVKESLPLFRMITAPVLRTPEEGADTIVYLAISEKVRPQDSGTFWFDRKIRPVVRLESTRPSEKQANELVHFCNELTGVYI